MQAINQSLIINGYKQNPFKMMISIVYNYLWARSEMRIHTYYQWFRQTLTLSITECYLRYEQRSEFLSNTDTHLAGTCQAKKYFIKKSSNFSILWAIETDNPTNAVFSFSIGYSLHCTRHPSGSRPLPEITPKRRPLPLMADQKTFGSVPSPNLFLQFLWLLFQSCDGS